MNATGYSDLDAANYRAALAELQLAALWFSQDLQHKDDSRLKLCALKFAKAASAVNADSIPSWENFLPSTSTSSAT